MRSKLWKQASREDKHSLTAVWQKTLPMMHKANAEGKMWQCVCGPLRATIATLIDQKWLPHHPSRWTAPCGTLEANIGQSESEDLEVAQFFKEKAQDKAWAQASAHYGGEGLEQGRPCLKPLRNAIAWFRKRVRDSEATALRTVACGGAHFGRRFNETAATEQC